MTSYLNSTHSYFPYSTAIILFVRGDHCVGNCDVMILFICHSLFWRDERRMLYANLHYLYSLALRYLYSLALHYLYSLALHYLYSLALHYLYSLALNYLYSLALNYLYSLALHYLYSLAFPRSICVALFIVMEDPANNGNACYSRLISEGIPRIMRSWLQMNMMAVNYWHRKRYTNDILKNECV